MCKSHFVFSILAIFILVSCSNETNEELQPQNAPLVVEGWIEDDDKPVVIVTRAAKLSEASGPVDNLVQRWCRVTVSGGEESEVLAMHINNDYLPPVIYTSSRLKGKIGHTYTLKVETDNETVTAVTTIPPIAKIDSLKIVPDINDASLYNVKVFTDATKAPYFKIFTRVNGEKRYYSSFLGIFTTHDYNANEGWNASRGIHQTNIGEHFTPCYNIGDTVRIKLCTMDEEGYRFWDSYETAVSLQSNFFFNSTDQCQGNIQGGKGYWIGYGTSFARCIIR